MSGSNRVPCGVSADLRRYHMKMEDEREITEDERDEMRDEILSKHRDELTFDTILDALAEMPVELQKIFVERMKRRAWSSCLMIFSATNKYLTPSDDEVDEAIHAQDLTHE